MASLNILKYIFGKGSGDKKPLTECGGNDSKDLKLSQGEQDSAKTHPNTRHVQASRKGHRQTVPSKRRHKENDQDINTIYTRWAHAKLDSRAKMIFGCSVRELDYTTTPIYGGICISDESHQDLYKLPIDQIVKSCFQVGCECEAQRKMYKVWKGIKIQETADKRQSTL